MMAEARSIYSANSTLDLDDDDRKYLDALADRDYVATKNTQHPLGLFSVVAFILQQIIGRCNLETKRLVTDPFQGTGIFRTPWTVMQATESVGITLLFWALGAFMAVAGTVLYIEFGLTTPRHLIDGKHEPVVRNGGDMNYVNIPHRALKPNSQNIGQLPCQTTKILCTVILRCELCPTGIECRERTIFRRRRYWWPAEQSQCRKRYSCSRSSNPSGIAPMFAARIHPSWWHSTQQRHSCGQTGNSLCFSSHGYLCSCWGHQLE